MKTLVGPLTAATLIASLTPAVGAFVIKKAEYKAGITEVHGVTSKPFQTVTLDGRYSTKSDASGRFVFWIRYLPLDCVINVKVQDEMHSAAIANCAT